MVIIKSAKLAVFGMLMIPVAFASLSVGILFASYNLAVSNNPDEADNIYSQTLIFFALIETFVFVTIGTVVLALVLIYYDIKLTAATAIPIATKTKVSINAKKIRV